MAQDPDRLVERSAFNYLDIDPSKPPYNVLNDAQLADYYLSITHFNSGIWTWDRISENLKSAARHAKKLKQREQHGIWSILFHHAQAAPSQEERDDLLSHSIMPGQFTSKRWVKFTPALRFDGLADAIVFDQAVDSVLVSWKRLSALFPEKKLRPGILCALSHILYEKGHALPAVTVLTWLKDEYPRHYKLRAGSNILRSRIHHVRALFPEMAPSWSESFSFWKGMLESMDMHQFDLRYPEARRLYKNLINSQNLPEKHRDDIHRGWQRFLKSALDLDDYSEGTKP